MGEIEFVGPRDRVLVARLVERSREMSGELVKAVVDVERGVMAIGGAMNADEEAALIEDGSSQPDLWGINLYPEDYGTDAFVEFDSMINLRPAQGNRSRSVEDPALRERIRRLVERVVQP